MKAEWTWDRSGSNQFLTTDKMKLGSVIWNGEGYAGCTFYGQTSKPIPDVEKAKAWVISRCLEVAHFIIEQLQDA